MKKYSLLALTGALLLGCSHKNEQSGVWIDMNGTYKEPMYLNYLKENYEKKFNKPFENENSKRVYFDENNAEWLDADMIIKSVESKFGK